LFRSFASRTRRVASAQTITNHLPSARVAGTLNGELRRAVLPGFSGPTDAAPRRRSPRPNRESRERYARAVDRPALFLPRFATVKLAGSVAPGATDAGGLDTERTTRSGLARALGRAAAVATTSASKKRPTIVTRT
jgi:hypothetical protein